MNRTKILAPVVAAMTALGVILGAQPASAHYIGNFIRLEGAWDVDDEGTGGCHVGYFCAWDKYGYDDYGIGFYNTKWDWAASDVPKLANGQSINDNSESWWNHGTPSNNNDVQIYQYAGGSGLSLCIQNGVQLDSWNGNPGDMRNRTSAHVWRSSC
ncbi:peptidase inhibitor family I36 protein [Catellatospora bangladeshensis]|uniref:Peptidase inhibitor family I36 protein n=1 Tax=Catellatospora bangladeshensis TaxID=310355 RepID=A0A8J3JP71_9ACTN|nr:peptidase inhibitor family I36 protein [Catellatospora bangladeshensis]GIF82323.1 hypothetical protein Cba03nite_36720 [Catellatospora bangladeshensis]